MACRKSTLHGDPKPSEEKISAPLNAWYKVKQRPIYLSLVTPRGSESSSTMGPEHQVDSLREEDKNCIRFTCHLCRLSTIGTLLALGKHLREQHRIQPEDVELAEAEQVIRKKATEEVLAAWQELTETRRPGEDEGSGQEPVLIRVYVTCRNFLRDVGSRTKRDNRLCSTQVTVRWLPHSIVKLRRDLAL